MEPPQMRVEKKSIPLADGPPIERPAKRVTAKEVGPRVRLLHNLIVEGPDGKSVFIPRGEILDFERVPERVRTTEYVEAPDAYREGKIMLLHDLTCAVPNFDGEKTSYREKLFSAFSLVDPASIPNRVMEGLVEGQDFLSSWDEDDRRVKELERQNLTEEFSMEGPEIPDDDSQR